MYCENIDVKTKAENLTLKTCLFQAPNACLELQSKLSEAEKDLAYYKAIYAPLIDGAARDANRIIELEKKLVLAIQFIRNVPDAQDNYGHELKQMCDDIMEKMESDK